MEPAHFTPTHDAVVAFGPFVLDRRAGRLRRGQISLGLRPKAWQVLCHLVDRPGELVTVDQLLDDVWKNVAVTPQTLTNVIGELRHALGDRPGRTRWIQTVHGLGYRFMATPRRLATDVAPGARPTLVGREVELDALADVWTRACGGQRQLVVLAGEPGIGKTTLADAFIRSVQEARVMRHVVARGTCVEQQGEREPYMPLVLAVDDLARGPWSRLVQSALRRHAPTWLVQLPWLLRGDEREQVGRSLAGATQVRMLREGATFIEALGRRHPVVLFLDDLHWADAATLEFVRVLVQRPTAARLMILTAYRPADAALEGHSAWRLVRELRVKGHASELALGPLDRKAVEAFITSRLADASIAAMLARRIEERASGNPLFVRSVVDHLLQGGRLTRGTDGWRLTGGDIDLPDALHAVVADQLGRLEPAARVVVEAASVAGMEFSTREVAAAVERSEIEVEASCHALASAGRLIRAAGDRIWADGSTSGRYVFDHAVHHQLTYDAVPAYRRRALHGRIAAALETAHASVRDVAASLAEHFARAGQPDKTIDYLALAGANAARRFAYAQGVEHVERALAILASRPDDHARTERESSLQRRLGSMLAMHAGTAAPATGAAFRRAFELADRVDAEPARLLASVGLTIHLITAARFSDARGHTERLLAVSRSLVPALLPLACCYAACVDSAAGELTRASRLLEEGASAREDARLPGFMDPHRMVDSLFALVLTERGALGRARVLRDAALARSRARGTPADLAHAAAFAAEAAVMQRDAMEAREASDVAIAVSQENGLPSYLLLARFYRACVDAGGGQVGAMADALAERRRIGDRWQESMLLGLLADARRCTGDVTGALATLDEADAFVADTGERHFRAELLRLRGECLATSGDEEASLDCLRRALAAATQNGARLWELRAATALAMRRDRSSARDDRRRLRDLVALFADERGRDIDDARAVLAQDG